MLKNNFIKIIIILLTLAISSCGFEVMYKTKQDGVDTSYIKELASIRIQKDRERTSQILKNNLYDLLNPNEIKTEPKYFLILELREQVSPTFITFTGASGRNKITISVNYTLKNLETAETISTGQTSVNDNYDVSDNRFGTYTAEEYIKENLTKLAAQNIRNSLVNDLIEHNKKGEDDDEEEEVEEEEEEEEEELPTCSG